MILMFYFFVLFPLPFPSRLDDAHHVMLPKAVTHPPILEIEDPVVIGLGEDMKDLLEPTDPDQFSHLRQRMERFRVMKEQLKAVGETGGRKGRLLFLHRLLANDAIQEEVHEPAGTSKGSSVNYKKFSVPARATPVLEARIPPSAAAVSAAASSPAAGSGALGVNKSSPANLSSSLHGGGHDGGGVREPPALLGTGPRINVSTGATLERRDTSPHLMTHDPHGPGSPPGSPTHQQSPAPFLNENRRGSSGLASTFRRTTTVGVTRPTLNG